MSHYRHHHHGHDHPAHHADMGHEPPHLTPMQDDVPEKEPESVGYLIAGAVAIFLFFIAACFIAAYEQHEHRLMLDVQRQVTVRPVIPPPPVIEQPAPVPQEVQPPGAPPDVPQDPPVTAAPPDDLPRDAAPPVQTEPQPISTPVPVVPYHWHSHNHWHGHHHWHGRHHYRHHHHHDDGDILPFMPPFPR
jgi:hypothetical protein